MSSTETDGWGELLPRLANPVISLQLFGQVQGQELDEPMAYDPQAITHRLQDTVLGYVAEPPIEPLTDEELKEGKVPMAKWLVLLGYRQAGKSLSAELAFWAKTEFTPGWEHICAADNKDRADYLFERVMFNRARWPEDLLSEQRVTTETRSLTLGKCVDGRMHDGKMHVITGNTAGAGVGRGTSSFHGSELPLWSNAPQQFSMIFPSMINRRRSLMLLESTPFPLSFPSAPWFQSMCEAASRGDSRFIYAFFPFWDGKLNARAWPTDSAITVEEQRLLDRYYKHGLRKRHLAFRRMMMSTDAEIKRNPELFKVYYPFDDVTCWVSTSSSIIRDRHLERQLDTAVVAWPAHVNYLEYEKPEESALYVIGVDPAGYGARDHASFQVLKCFAGEWTQVACFAGATDPPAFSRKLKEVGLRYNKAMIVVERNGVGLGVITLLEEWGYPNIFYDRGGKPGIHKSSHENLVSDLIDALTDELVLRDKNTLLQLQTYQSDKAVERTVKAEILHSGGSMRRDRHHWDKVSALMMAVQGARFTPTRYRPEPQPENVVLFRDMTWGELQDYDRRVEKFSKKNRSRVNRRATYTSIRRRK